MPRSPLFGGGGGRFLYISISGFRLIIPPSFLLYPPAAGFSSSFLSSFRGLLQLPPQVENETEEKRVFFAKAAACGETGNQIYTCTCLSENPGSVALSRVSYKDCKQLYGARNGGGEVLFILTFSRLDIGLAVSSFKSENWSLSRAVQKKTVVCIVCANSPPPTSQSSLPFLRTPLTFCKLWYGKRETKSCTSSEEKIQGQSRG